jgi:hypothetical protein
LFRAWTSLHESSYVQCFIGFSKPLSVLIMLWIQEGMVFVSIVLCTLDMDKLEMFNFLEDEFHIVRTIGLGLKTIKTLCQKKCCRSNMLLMKSFKFKKMHVGCNN